MLLQVNNISKAFGNPSDATFQPVLKELNFEVEEGNSYAILGPSGSGKSTLLNIIGVLEKPDSGEILFRGNSLSDYSARELDHFRNREIGFVFQFHHLLPQLNVLENVLIPTLVGKKDKAESLSYAESLLERVGMSQHIHKKPGQLSGGECQRVALVRAMINRPSLILADEPTGALDREHAESISDLLRMLNEEDKLTLISVTHSEKFAGQMKNSFRLENGQLLRS